MAPAQCVAFWAGLFVARDRLDEQKRTGGQLARPVPRLVLAGLKGLFAADDSMAKAMSLVASTRGVALMPAYAKNLLPWSVVSRPGRRGADDRTSRGLQQVEHVADP